MIAQYIQLGNRDWNVLIYYGVTEDDFTEVADSLKQLGCPDKQIRKAFKILRKENTGMTFSNSDYKMSIVCIGHAASID